MKQFVKIYGETLLNSTLWLECWQARMTFIGMLAAADYEGFCAFPSVPALAHRLNLPVDEVKKGLEVLEAPDADSRSKAEEGRRVLRTEGGWQLVNYSRYREARTLAQVQGAARTKRHYEKHGRVRNVSTNEITADLRSRSKKEKEEIENARARPGPVDRVAEPGFTARRMQTLFVREYEAVLRDSPSMGGKNLADFHARVLRSAQLQSKDAEGMFLAAVRVWLAKPRTEVELRAPYACFAQAWGGLAAPETSKTTEGSAQTPDGLRRAAEDAAASGDYKRAKALRDQIEVIESRLDSSNRRR